MNYWKENLGFEPEQNFEPQTLENKCYKCDGDNCKSMPSMAWSSLKRCNDCGYYTYVIYNDRMGGAFYDNVAIDSKLSKNNIWIKQT